MKRTLKRNKAAIACKRLKGRHTFDVIGDGMDFFGFEIEPEESYSAEK